MYLVIFIFMVLLLLCYLIYKKPLTAFLVFDTDSSDFNVRLKWLFPLFEAKIEIVEYSPFVTLFVFKKNIYAKTIGPPKKQKQKLSDYYRSLALSNIFARIYYSFNDPFSTGITSGIFQIIQMYLNNISIAQYPNFIADHAYMTIHLGAKLNLGKTIANIIRKKLSNKKYKRREQYGTI